MNPFLHEVNVPPHAYDRRPSVNITPRHEDTQQCNFFVVQKCWHSGPNVTPPVDYLRLLPSIGEAEQVAYQSAHTFSGGTSPVRTIQLPMKDHAASSYGFVANGVLFWIRRIHALTSAGVAVNPIVDSAHCILTHGVIGDTGNANSRRGIENVNSARAFVGPAGYAWALKQSASGLIPSGSTCQWVPVGKPNFENITAEWPDRNTWFAPSQGAQTSSNGQTKRLSDSSHDTHYWFSTSCNNGSYPDGASRSQTTMFSDGIERSYENMPPAKRLCPPRYSFQADSGGGFQAGVATSVGMDISMVR